jgi:hypothetical protein
MQKPRRTPKVAGPRRDEFTEPPTLEPYFTDAFYPSGDPEYILSVDSFIAELIGLRASPSHNRRGATYLKVGRVTA